MLPVHFKFIPQDSPGLISNPGIRECHLTSGKVILHGVLTQKVTLGHLKFIPKTSPGVIGNPGIGVSFEINQLLLANALEKSFCRGF